MVHWGLQFRQVASGERPRNEIRPEEGRSVIALLTQTNRRGGQGSRNCAQHAPTLMKSRSSRKRTGRPARNPWTVDRTFTAGDRRAVSTLLKVMVDAGTPPSTRVRAADSVLDHSAKAIELEDLEARLAALEQATEATRRSR